MTDKATDVTELKPCPFCGAIEAVLHPLPPDARGFYSLQDRGPYYGHCDNCGADGPGKSTEAEAIAAWNHLTASEQPASGETIDQDDLETLIDDAISDSFELDWTSMRGARAVVGAFEHVGWSVVKGRPLSTTSEAPAQENQQ